MSQRLAVTEQAFPKTAPAADILRFLVHYAALVPSSHSTQPFMRFGHGGDTPPSVRRAVEDVIIR
jgi:hypothetical protein